MNISALFPEFYERVYRSEFGVPLLLTLLFEIRYTGSRLRAAGLWKLTAHDQGYPAALTWPGIQV